MSKCEKCEAPLTLSEEWDIEQGLIKFCRLCERELAGIAAEVEGKKR